MHIALSYPLHTDTDTHVYFKLNIWAFIIFPYLLLNFFSLQTHNS